MEKSKGLPIKLSAPAQRALANAGIKTLQQITAYSEKELLALHGVGKTTIVAIRQAFKENKMAFKK